MDQEKLRKNNFDLKVVHKENKNKNKWSNKWTTQKTKKQKKTKTKKKKKKKENPPKMETKTKPVPLPWFTCKCQGENRQKFQGKKMSWSADVVWAFFFRQTDRHIDTQTERPHTYIVEYIVYEMCWKN